MKEKWLAWWQQRETREKQLIAIAIGLLVIGFLWVMVWKPIQDSVDNSRKQGIRHQQALTWMQQHAEELVSLQKEQKKRPVLSGSIESVIYQSAKQGQVSIRRIQPQGQQLSVDIEKIDFNRLLDWCASLEQQYGIMVNSIDINKDDKQPGMIQVRRLILQGMPDE